MLAGEIPYINSDVKGRAKVTMIEEPPNWPDETRHRELTRQVYSSAFERAKYGGRRCDLIGQLECRFEDFISWKPWLGTPRTDLGALSRAFYHAVDGKHMLYFEYNGSSEHGHH